MLLSHVLGAGSLLCVLMLPAAASAQTAAPLSVKEQGARHGQALAAAKICPGARVTANVAALAAAVADADKAAFAASSADIVAAWDKAFACTDVDPAQTREINGCRKAKILSCSTTWQEIGPDGMALPGLLEFKPADAADAP